MDGFLKDRQTYEIMRPEDVGLAQSRVVLTARTGRAGLRARLEKLGHKLSKEDLDVIYQRFLAVADKKLEVFDEDLVAIVRDESHPVPGSLAARILAGFQRYFGHPHRHPAPARPWGRAGGGRHRQRSRGRRL